MRLSKACSAAARITSMDTVTEAKGVPLRVFNARHALLACAGHLTMHLVCWSLLVSELGDERTRYVLGSPAN